MIPAHCLSCVPMKTGSVLSTPLPKTFNNMTLPTSVSEELRVLPCLHVFCLSCLRSYYRERTAGSTMRVAAIPCPYCRVLVDLPRSSGGVDDFPDPTMWQPIETEEECRTPTNEVQNNEDERTMDDERDGHVDSPLTGQAHVRFVFPEVDGHQVRSTMSVNITNSTVHRTENEINSEVSVNGVRKLTVMDNDAVLKTVKTQGDDTYTTASGEINNNTINIENKSNVTGLTDSDVQRRGSPQIRWQTSSNNREFPKSIAIVSGSRGSSVIAEYGIGRLNFINRNGETEFSVSGVKPVSVAADHAGRILVGDRKSKTLVTLDTEGREVGNWPSECFPWIAGIGVLRNGNIVICDRNFSRIGIYTASGDHKIREFGSYGGGDEQMCMADYLTVDDMDRIIVSDSANHCIKIFDVTGSQLAKIGSRGAADGRLCWPHGVCCLGSGSDGILVADTMNERVCLFSSSGRFIEHVLKDIPRPIGICYDSGSLGVTHFAKSGYSECCMYSY